MHQRPRRNRKSENIRRMTEETSVGLKDFIYPLFVSEVSEKSVSITSMPGIFRFGERGILNEIEACMKLGLTAFALFPHLPEKKKNKTASESWNPKCLYLRTIKSIKLRFPEAVIMADTAMDPYSSDGHDGLVKEGKILNDASLPILARMALAQAEAGADIIGPSDMIDGRIGYIRKELDEQGFQDVSLMAYTAKYASAFYGPFRDALESAPKSGDKKTYQMNPANIREALREAQLDTNEGADFLMVKPAMAYLDVISLLRQHFQLPIAAYNVSGEYAMVKAAAERGWVNGKAIRDEILTGIKRAGADLILSYFAKEWAADQQK